MIVETHASGRLFGRAYRNEQLEFQRLLDLAHGHKLDAAAEESVARLIHAIRQSQLIGELLRADHPAFAEVCDLFGRTDTDILAHAERLQPVEIARRLAAKTIAGDVEQKPFGRQFAADGPER